jgi:hypothetical protein
MNEPIDDLREMLLIIARSLVDRPGDVRVDAVPEGEAIAFSLCAHPQDTGKLIGVGGRTARAIRVLLHANGVKLKLRLSLNICSPEHDQVERSSAAA